MTLHVCHCSSCDEPDPHCEHGVNLAVAVCARCTPMQFASCARLLFSGLYDGDYRTFFACDDHRLDLVRGVGMKDYWPKPDYVVRELPKVHAAADMQIPCSYCVESHRDISPTTDVRLLGEICP